MSYLPLIIQLFSGAAGGNIAGGLMKNMSLGTMWNSVAGILGGGLGGQVLGMLTGGATAAATGDADTGMDIGNILGSVASGGVGGGIGLGAVALIKKMMGGGNES